MKTLSYLISLFLNALAIQKLLRRLPDHSIESVNNEDGRCLVTFDNPIAVLAAGYPNVLKVTGREHDVAYDVSRQHKNEASQSIREPRRESPIEHFLAECCDFYEHYRIIKKEVYLAYCRWACENDHEVLSLSAFGKEFLAASGGRIKAEGQKQNEDGKRNHCYRGVRLKSATTPKERKQLSETGPIEAIDLETGRTELFPTLKAAEKAGFCKYSILRVLNGEARKHKGMSWRYWQGPHEVAPCPDSPEIAISVLTETMKRDELRRLTQSVTFDELKQQWAIRLPGRTLYRETRPEAVSVWYTNQHSQQAPVNPPEPTSSPTLRERLASDLLHKLIDLSANKWRGTGTALAAVLKIDVTTDVEVREFVTEVRMLKPALEENGVLIKFNKDGGHKIITIWRARVLSPVAQQSTPIPTPTATSAKAIEGIELSTGEVTLFASLNVAELAGYRKHSICDVIHGRRESYAGKIWRYKSDCRSLVLQNTDKKRSMKKRIAETKEARIARLLNRIAKLPKPWGPGTATDLAAALGEWYGPAVSPVAPACSLGHVLPQITRQLAAIGTRVEISMDTRQKMSTYTVRASNTQSLVA